MTLTPAFPCNQCGACCRHVNRASETQFLDRGDGICRHYQMETAVRDKNTSAYFQVDKQYQLNYQQQYSWQEFNS
jgi:hypothetical protein